MNSSASPKKKVSISPASKQKNPKKVQQRTSIEGIEQDPKLLCTIAERGSDECVQSGQFLKSIREVMDEQTIRQIETYRNLELPALKGMSEEETYIRFVKDPFFRVKLQCELRYLSKTKRPDSQENKKKKKILYGSINEIEIEGKQNKVTFREYKQQKQAQKIKKKDAYEDILKKVSSHPQLSKFFNV